MTLPSIYATEMHLPVACELQPQAQQLDNLLWYLRVHLPRSPPCQNAHYLRQLRQHCDLVYSSISVALRRYMSPTDLAFFNPYRYIEIWQRALLLDGEIEVALKQTADGDSQTPWTVSAEVASVPFLYSRKQFVDQIKEAVQREEIATKPQLINVNASFEFKIKTHWALVRLLTERRLQPELAVVLPIQKQAESLERDAAIGRRIEAQNAVNEQMLEKMQQNWNPAVLLETLKRPSDAQTKVPVTPPQRVSVIVAGPSVADPNRPADSSNQSLQNKQLNNSTTVNYEMLVERLVEDIYLQSQLQAGHQSG